MSTITIKDQLEGHDHVEHRRVANNTVMFKQSTGEVCYKLHNTVIITKHPDGYITLNTDGWQTPTTKERFNRILKGVRVWQENRAWFLSYGGQTYAYKDEMVLHPDGTVTGAKSMKEVEKQRKLAKSIRAYATGFITALDNGKVPAPSGGDCLYCSLSFSVVGSGKSIGEAAGDVSHLLSHIGEKYYVPSLLVRATKEFPVSMAANCWMTGKWSGEAKEYYGLKDIAKDQLKKSLTRYLYRQFGIAA